MKKDILREERKTEEEKFYKFLRGLTMRKDYSSFEKLIFLNKKIEYQ
jgi:hypothetical protein